MIDRGTRSAGRSTRLALLFFAVHLAFAQAVTYTYDSAGHLISADYGSAGTITYTYDRVGNLLTRTVSGASQTITFNALSNVTYGVAPFTINATASSGLTVTFNSTTSGVCTVTGNTVTIAAGGMCSIVASQGGNSSYSSAPNVTQSFTVNPASQIITFAALPNVTLGVSPFTISASASSGLSVSFVSNSSSVCTVAGSIVTIAAAGTCSITASQLGNASYTSATPVTQMFTVSAGGRTAQTITFGALSNVTFGISPFTISASASSGLAVTFASTTSGVCTVAGNTVTIVGGGGCSIVASQLGNSTYSAAPNVTQGFTVNPASQTITFAALGNVTLGVSPFNISASASSGLTVAFASNTSAVCTVAGNTVTILAVGTCSITASQTGNASYTAATPVTETFTVSTAGSGSAAGLVISLMHSGEFTQGQSGVIYIATVSNTGTASTTGVVTVTELAPNGLAFVAMSGSGWTCVNSTCSRSDSLNGGASYPVLTITMNVTANAVSPLANAVSVTGNGSLPTTASDSTIIAPSFFYGQIYLGNSVYYLQFPDSDLFGYYGFLSGGWIYHFDLGYEYVDSGSNGTAFIYDLTTGHWWYSSNSVFPYIFDFNLNTWLYYFPNTTSAGHYTSNPRYFANLNTGAIFTM